MKININFFVENIKTIFYALLIAILIRSIILQPFYIPSSSMEPTLQVGDRLFVSKYSYGYSKHSFPFSPNLTQKRYFYKQPKRGDVIVFKTPADNRTDYIKRLIGLPGDIVQFIDGDLYLNNNQILKTKVKNLKLPIYCGDKKIKVNFYKEKLTKNSKNLLAYKRYNTYLNSDKFLIPKDHFFFLGDNRDCSKDSRYLSSVGYVHKNNLVGKAQFIFFSSDARIGSIFKFWKWKKILRVNRFLKKIK